MLKLEKSSKLSGVIVGLREKECFFEPRLLQALALALVLHVGSIIFFHITPFSFSSTFVFPPINVQSSAMQSVSAVTVYRTQRSEDDFMPPPISLIPPLEQDYISKESLLTPSLSLNPDAFKSFEEMVWPLWNPPLTFYLEEPRIRLFISGDLANRPLISKDPLLDQKKSINEESSPVHVAYNVQVDEEGAVFWFEPTQKSGRKEIDQLAEKIVLSLRFASDPHFESDRGLLEFVILKKAL